MNTINSTGCKKLNVHCAWEYTPISSIIVSAVGNGYSSDFDTCSIYIWYKRIKYVFLIVRRSSHQNKSSYNQHFDDVAITF